MSKTPDTLRLELARGIYGRIAAQLGLGPNGRIHVWRVAHGERQSPRVQAALASEWRKINAKVRRYEQKLAQQAEAAA